MVPIHMCRSCMTHDNYWISNISLWCLERKTVLFFVCLFIYNSVCFCSLYRLHLCLCWLYEGLFLVLFWEHNTLIMASPVTMTVRMFALWRSCSTPADSAFSLFCMIIRPRNSMLASMWSLFQRNKHTTTQFQLCANSRTLLEDSHCYHEWNHWKDKWHDKKEKSDVLSEMEAITILTYIILI